MIVANGSKLDKNVPAKDTFISENPAKRLAKNTRIILSIISPPFLLIYVYFEGMSVCLPTFNLIRILFFHACHN